MESNVLESIENEIKLEINASINFALSSPEPDLKDLKRYLFTDSNLDI